jgi:hypothetical protein
MRSFFELAAGALGAWVLGIGIAQAASVTTLYTFTGGTDGAYPIGGLILGPGGDYYGTTALGGAGCNGAGCGTVFRYTPPAAGQSSGTLTTLYTFVGGADGQEPVNLITDSKGNLYGVAQYGGDTPNLCVVGGTVLGCGTVYELSPPPAGSSTWVFTTLYTFSGGADGSFPNYGLTMDASGALYGFTYGGGTCATKTCGTAYKLTPPAAGQTGWTQTTLHNFNAGVDGTAPYGTPLVDSAGNVYGTTTAGGYTGSAICGTAGGCGTVFELSPPAAGKTAWSKKTLWAFTGAGGLYPEGNLTADTAGNLYGTTNLGGATTVCVGLAGTPPGCGSVFKLAPPAAGATAWTFSTLYKFSAKADGLYPSAGLTPKTTSFYTTTSGNGPMGFGSVVQLSPPASGKLWTETTLYDFTNGTDGAQPTDTLLLRGGVLYGTTLGHDGAAPARYGTLFSLKP